MLVHSDSQSGCSQAFSSAFFPSKSRLEWVKRKVTEAGDRCYRSCVKHPDGLFSGGSSIDVNMLFFHGEHYFGQDFLVDTLRVLEQHGVDLSRLHAITPTAPLRRLHDGSYQRHYFGYQQNLIGDGKNPCDLTNFTLACGKLNCFSPTEDALTAYLEENSFDKLTNKPLVVGGSSLGGVLALQYAAELGADLCFLHHSIVKSDCFFRDRIDARRPLGRGKTKILMVAGSNDAVFPLNSVYSELSKIAQAHADIFEAPVLLVQQFKGHTPSDYDLVPLATQLVRAPFSLVRKGEADRLKLSEKDWFDIATSRDDSHEPPQKIMKWKKVTAVPGRILSVIIPKADLGGYLWDECPPPLSCLAWNSYPSELNDALHPDVTFRGEGPLKSSLVWLEDETRESNDLLHHLESLEELGVDLQSVLALSPTPPSRAVDGVWKRMYFSYSGSGKPNAEQFTTYLSDLHSKCSELMTENNPMASIGIGRSSILALQFAAERGARTVFVGLCSVGFARAFDRSRALKVRGQMGVGDVKTRIVIVQAEQLCPLQSIYDELHVLLQSNADLFELDQFLLRRLAAQCLHGDDLAPLAAIIRSEPFNSTTLEDVKNIDRRKGWDNISFNVLQDNTAACSPETRCFIIPRNPNGALWQQADDFPPVIFPDASYQGSSANGIGAKFLWFLGENTRASAMYKTIEDLQLYGVDVGRLDMHFPNAPLRPSPWPPFTPSRMWYTYKVDIDEVGKLHSTEAHNTSELFEYIDAHREKFRDRHVSQTPFVVAGTSLGGLVAVQYAAEFGASLLFLRRSCPDVKSFDRQRVDRHRPSSAGKTKILVVNANNDTEYPAEDSKKALDELVQANSDIFESPVMLIHEKLDHRSHTSDIAPLADVLKRHPFNIALRQDNDSAQSQPGWFELADGSPQALVPPGEQVKRLQDTEDASKKRRAKDEMRRVDVRSPSPSASPEVRSKRKLLLVGSSQIKRPSQSLG